MPSVILKLKATTGFLIDNRECLSGFRPVVFNLTPKVQGWIDDGKAEFLMNPAPEGLTDYEFAQRLLANGGDVAKLLAELQPAPAAVPKATQAKKAQTSAKE